MKKLAFKVLSLITITGLMACGGSEKPEEETLQDSAATDVVPMTDEIEMEAMEKDGIKLSIVENSPEFPDAKISLVSPENSEGLTAGSKTKFKFNVENYDLGNQTEDAEGKMCANSAKGQHIHFIVNNRPYEANYTAEFESELEEGNNVVLAFLSRSYHMSIKQPDAMVVSQFQTGGAEPADLSGEHLFYSRPKGTYVGKDTEKLLLDFYLVNTSINNDGNRVKVTINGTDFILTEWAPYYVEGLPMGENTFRIQLIDKDDNAVPGPFNDSGERKITLEAAPEGDAM